MSGHLATPPYLHQPLQPYASMGARIVTNKHEADDSSDFEESVNGVELENGSEVEEEEQTGSEDDSDSLDSTNSRKRRRLSPALDPDSDDDVPVSKISIPSRISAPSRIKASSKSTLPAPALEASLPNTSILAPIDQNTTFDSLGLKPWLVNSLASMAIRRPTGIQKGCIPEILKGRDCIGGSRTGSGKTVAFAAPILQKWAEDPVGIFALILTPTRYVFIIQFSQPPSLPTLNLDHELTISQRTCPPNLRTNKSHLLPPIPQTHPHHWRHRHAPASAGPLHPPAHRHRDSRPPRRSHPHIGRGHRDWPSTRQNGRPRRS